MRELDLAWEKGDGAAMAAATDSDRAEVEAASSLIGRSVEDANIAELKTILPADGWFRISRYGKQTASDAWFILQHTSNYQFQASVLRAMEPMIATGDVSGDDYGLLYDRVQMGLGKPQRYGSQVVCVRGKYELYPIEDPQSVDQRRKQLGFTRTLDQYVKYAGYLGASC